MLIGSIAARDQARKLRKSLSLPEVLLWQRLLLRPGGLKFRRQHPAGDYVLDFYCVAARLVIEIDGATHGEPQRAAFDKRRDDWLIAQDVRVLRIAASDVLRSVSDTVEVIVAACGRQTRPPLHHAAHGPPPRAGEDHEERPWTT